MSKQKSGGMVRIFCSEIASACESYMPLSKHKNRLRHTPKFNCAFYSYGECTNYTACKNALYGQWDIYSVLEKLN